MKISHAADGTCTADVMAGARTQSILKRLIIDNQQMQHNALRGFCGRYQDPQDLLDNTIGGVIWSRQPV